MTLAPNHLLGTDEPETEMVAESLLDVDERLVVTPVAGYFAPAARRVAAEPQATTVDRGDSVGVVTSLGQVHDVVSNFTGDLMGYLVLPGERVRAGQPVAWLRATLTAPIELPPR